MTSSSLSQLDDPFDGHVLDDINLGMTNESITFLFRVRSVCVSAFSKELTIFSMERTRKQVDKTELEDKKKMTRSSIHGKRMWRRRRPKDEEEENEA